MSNSNREKSPSTTALTSDMGAHNNTEKQGAICFFCCFDMRRASMIVSILFMCLSALTLTALIVSESIHLETGSDFDDDVLLNTVQSSYFQCVITSIGLVTSLASLVGAMQYNIWLIGANILWILVNFISMVVIEVKIYQNVDETYVNNMDIRFEWWYIILGGLISMSGIYPLASFIREIRIGIMSKEMYLREDYSFCRLKALRRYRASGMTEMVLKRTSNSVVEKEGLLRDTEHLTNSSIDTRIVNRWRPRHLYIAQQCWFSITAGPFLAPFLQHEADLSTTQIGALLAIHQGINIFSSSIGGSWADATERRYPLKGRAIVMAFGSFLGGFFLVLHSMNRLTRGTTFFDSIYWYGLLRILYSAFSSFVPPVMDGMCLDFLERQPGYSTKDFGKERWYGAVSWAITHILMAPGLDYFGLAFLYPLTVLSTLFLVATLYGFAQEQYRQGRSLDRGGNIREQIDGEHSSKEPADSQIPMTSLLKLVVMSWFGIAFVFTVITLSGGRAVVENLIFLYFEYLGSSYTVMGITIVFTVICEYPIFMNAPALLERFGAGALLQVAAIAYFIRAIGYTLIPMGQIWYALLLEPMHGVTFACYTTAGVDFMNALMPPGYEASGQGLLMAFVGVGAFLGLLFGGWADDVLGSRSMYRIAALVVFAGFTVFGLALWCRRRSNQRERNVQPELSEGIPMQTVRSRELS